MAIVDVRSIGRYLISRYSPQLNGRTCLSLYVFFIFQIVLFSSAVWQSPPVLAQSTWEKTAGPSGVEVNVIYETDNVLFAGTEHHGVFRSVDGGRTWVKANSGIERRRISDMIASGGNLLVAAGASDCAGSLNVFKSTNNGDTWTPTTGLDDRVVTSFAKKGNFIYAVFDAQSTNGNGVFRSVDDGSTWSAVPSVNPISNPDRIFVSGNSILVSASNFIMRSIDDGASWDLVEQFAFSGVHSFSKAGTRLFAAETTGFAVSDDDGVTWDFTYFPDGVLSFASDGKTIFLGARSKVFKSSDFGQNWSDDSNGLGHGDIKALWFNGTSLFAGTTTDPSGIFRSTDDGASWSAAAAGLPVASNVRSMISSGGYVFAGTNGDGVYRSNDRGLTWSKTDTANPLITHQSILSFTVKNNTIFVGSDNGVFRSIDDGTTFVRIHNGLPPNTQVFGSSLTVSGNNLIAALTILVSATETLDGIFYSSDNGDTWHQANVPNGPIYVSSVESDGSPLVYAGVYTQTFSTTGLYKSTDNGITWSFRPSLMADIERISAKGSNVLASTLFTPFFSNDFGELGWTSSPLPGRPIFGTGIDTYTRRENFVYAGNEGMYVSANGGASWSDFKQGFPVCPNPQVQSSTFDGSYLYAGTDGEGVFRRLVDAPPATLSAIPYDFDGDRKSDISIYRPSLGQWWFRKSSNLETQVGTWGLSTDIVVPDDFTGDGKADLAVFRPETGEWFVLRSDDNSYFAIRFGQSEDIPMPADFDGDGKTDLAVFRPSQGLWFILRSRDGGVTFADFGQNGDQPVAADYDGDGRADVGIVRNISGNIRQWWIQRSTLGLAVINFGAAGDKTVQGDYTGDGKADVAVFRPRTGEWFILRSDDLSYFGLEWGTNGDVPVPGDYNGDGKFDPAVFRPSDQFWYIDQTSGKPLFAQFGVSTDQPIPGAFNR